MGFKWELQSKKDGKVNDNPKTEEEEKQHQVEVKWKGKHTAKKLADSMLREANKERYIELMKLYYTLEDEARDIETDGNYF